MKRWRLRIGRVGGLLDSIPAPERGRMLTGVIGNDLVRRCEPREIDPPG